MEKRWVFILLVVVAILSVGCKGPVSYKSKNVGAGPSSAWRTFHLSTAKSEFVSGNQTDAAEAEQLVHDAVTRVLADRGYTKSSLEDADFFMAIHAHSTPMEQVFYYKKQGYRDPKYDLSAARSWFDDRAIGLQVMDSKNRTVAWDSVAYYQEQGLLDLQRLEKIVATAASKFPTRVEER
jgi:hypothetical protein